MPYAVGYGGYGRQNVSKCHAGKNCKLQSEKGESVIKGGQMQFAVSFGANGRIIKQWKHWECVTDIQKTNFRSRHQHVDSAQLEGYSDLRDDDKAKINQVLGRVTPSAAPPSGTSAGRHPGSQAAGQESTVDDPPPKYEESQPAPKKKKKKARKRPEDTQNRPSDNQNASTPTASGPEKTKQHRPPKTQDPPPKTQAHVYNDMPREQPTATHSSDPDVHLRRAAAYVAQKAFKQALEAYRAAVALQSSSKAFAQLANCQLALGDPQAAIQSIESAVNLCDHSNMEEISSTRIQAEQMWRDIDHSRQAWADRDWEEAKRSLAKASVACVGERPLRWLTWEIEIELALGNWDNAENLSRAVRKQHQDEPEAHAASGLVYFLGGDMDSAIEYLRAALKIDPECGDAAVLLRKARSVQKQKQSGDQLYRSEEYLAAVEAYGEALDTIDGDEVWGIGSGLRALLLSNRAVAKMGLRNFLSAIEDCQAALPLQNPAQRPKTHVRLARCYLATGNPVLTLDHVNLVMSDAGAHPFQQSIREINEDAEKLRVALDQRQTLWEQNDWAGAKEALQTVVAMFAWDPPLQWTIWEIEIGIANKNWNLAISLARATLDHNQESSEVLTVLGLAMFLTNELPESLDFLNQALQTNPSHGPALGLLRRVEAVEKLKKQGNESFRLTEYKDAVRKYTEALEVIGDDGKHGEGGYIRAALLSNRALAYIKMDRYPSASPDLKIALVLHPENAKVLRMQARVQLAQGYFEEAGVTLKRALDACSSADSVSAEAAAIADGLKQVDDALKMRQAKDYHGILKITTKATADDVKKAYRRASLLYHPDKGGNPEYFKLLLEAYTIVLGAK